MIEGPVLVTGATGLLGPYLVETSAATASTVTTARRAGDVVCDLTDRSAVARMMKEVRPRLVLHAAAMTDVDACEVAKAEAFRVNRDATGHLANALDGDARLVHFSTDQVYPDVPGPHREGSERPVNVYGRSKLAGETAALAHPRALVLRVNFFGPSRTPGRASLSDFIARKLETGDPLTLFRDSLFSALHMTTVTALVFDCVRAGLTGVYNLGSRAGTSKLDFGMAMARHLGLATTTARPGNARDIPGRAPRSADLRMDVGRIEGALDRPMPTLGEEIEKL